MIYPVLLSAVGIVSITILTLFVVPRFTSIFQDMGVPLPLPMAILKACSTFLTYYWWLALALIVVIGIYFRTFPESEQGRLKWDRWLFRFPWSARCCGKSK